MSVWKALFLLGVMWVVLQALGRSVGELLAAREAAHERRREDSEASRHAVESEPGMPTPRRRWRGRRARAAGDSSDGMMRDFSDDELRGMLGQDLLQQLRALSEEQGYDHGLRDTRDERDQD